jgi:hypothetical protein
MTYPRAFLGVLVVLGAAMAGSVQPAMASTTDHVTTCAASGAGSLAAVVSSAAAGDTIVFDQDCSGSNVILLSSPITISKSLTIDGSGHTIVLDGGSTTGDGSNAPGIFWVQGAGATLANLTLQNGVAGFGGAIENNSALLTVTGCTFSNNVNSAILNWSVLQVSNSTFTANSNATGGAIHNEGTLTVVGTTFAGNRGEPFPTPDGIFLGGDGGAIANSGQATVSSSVFSLNTATRGGGAIDNTGTLTVTSSSFTDNSVAPDNPVEPPDIKGGAIRNDEGSLTVVMSTFNTNQAGFEDGTFTEGGAVTDGGAIDNYAGFAIINSDTFFNNSAGEGGALDNEIDPSGGGVAFPFLVLHNSTFYGNGALSGGGIFNHGGQLIIAGTILANSQAGYNCVNGDSGLLSDGGYNLAYNANDPSHDGGTVCGLTAVGDLLNTNPQLIGLGSNGGPTKTMALPATSPAIDQIPASSALCPATDQRGAPRPDAGEVNCDIGAFEYQDDTNLSPYPLLANGGFNLTNAGLANAYLVAANLADASLINGTFTSANFTLASLVGANLTNGTFTSANFTLASLAGANLTNGRFKGANLTDANLANANLRQANLNGVTLTGVAWSNTICPDGTNSNNDGGTCQGHL